MGYRTRILPSSGAVSDADILIALHAYKTAALVAEFRKRFPKRPIVVVLTGTDVYSSRLQTRAATKTLEAAGAIVTLQPLAIERLPKRLHEKAIAVLQSAQRVESVKKTSRQTTRLCVLGHLRREKDPLRAAYALAYLKNVAVEVIQAGGILDRRYAPRIASLESREPRYTYLGEIAQKRALRLLAGCDALVLSSRAEGGANVASEAIANGVPVLASRIDGNVGVFGPRYAGYYTAGSGKSLAALIERFVRDKNFARLLRRQIRALAPSVKFERERHGLARAIALARRL